MIGIHGICPLVFVEKTYPSQPFLRGNSSGVAFDKGESCGYQLPQYFMNVHNRWAIIISPYGTRVLLNTSRLSEKAQKVKGFSSQTLPS
jgi:hypothetical protein